MWWAMRGDIVNPFPHNHGVNLFNGSRPLRGEHLPAYAAIAFLAIAAVSGQAALAQPHVESAHYWLSHGSVDVRLAGPASWADADRIYLTGAESRSAVTGAVSHDNDTISTVLNNVWNGFEELSHPRYVAVPAGGSNDIQGINPDDMRTAISYDDAEQPKASLAAYDACNNILQVSFNEPISHIGAQKVSVHGADSASMPVDVVLYGSGSTTVRMDLDMSDKTPSVLSVSAGGAADIWDNANAVGISYAVYVSPVNGTAPPVNGTVPPPVNGTAPPVNGTVPPPVNGTVPPPVNGTQPPVNGTAPPVNGTVPPPVNGTVPPPVNGTVPPPVNGTVPPPVNGTVPPPVNGTAPPVNGTAPPVNGTAPPVNGTAPPVNGTAPPVNGTVPPPVNGTVPPPVNGTAPPVNGTVPPPVNGTAPPVNGTVPPPVNGTAPPVNGTVPPPVNGTAPPVNGTVPPPVNGTAPPVNGTVPPPVNGTAPPVNGTVPPPVNGTAPPVNGTVPPPVNGTAPPVNGTVPPPVNGTATIQFSSVTYNAVTGEIRFDSDYNGTLFVPAGGKNATLTDGIYSVTVPVTNPDCPNPPSACTGNDAAATIGQSARGWFVDSPAMYVDAPPGILVAGVPGNITGKTVELDRGNVTVLNPVFMGAAYHTGNGTVSIQFSKDIGSMNGSKMGIAAGSSTAYLTGNSTISGSIIRLVLSDADRNLFAGIAPLTMHVGEGAVTSTAGYSNAATGGKNVTVYDGIKPKFLNATYHTGNGTISMRFSEGVGVADGSKLRLGDGANAVRLSDNATISHNVVTDALNQTGRDMFAHAGMMSLDIRRGAIADLAGNRIDASANNTISVRDTTKPTVLRAAYHTGNGTILAQFSEAVIALNGIPINITYGNNTLQLQGAAANNTATATLEFEDRAKISGITSLNLTIPAEAVQDMHGNRMDAVSDMPLDIVQDNMELGFAAAASANAASFGANDFVTTWQTTTGNETITIDVDGHTGTYTVNWGDGTSATTHSGNANHTYATAGSYNVSISGDFQRIRTGADATNAAKLTALVQWGNMSWSSMEESFKYASYMQYKAADTPDLARVTDMDYMFNSAYYFSADLSSWDVSKVTSMRGTFESASSFRGNISTWDVSGVTDMSYMFHSARQFNGNISAWDVSSVTNMSRMFVYVSAFNADLTTWDVSSVTDMQSMFFGASFRGNISTWDVSSVTDMYSMFYSARLFNGNISKWNVSSVTDMSYMFYDTRLFNGNISKWNVSSVTDMSHMFHRAIAFNGSLSSWDVSGVTDMSHMFHSATSFNGDVSGWDISKVTNMADMFNRAASFNGDVSGWDVSKVTNMQYMFHQAASFNSSLTSWDVSRITNMGYVFHSAASFNGNVSGWDVSRVTNMENMFYGTSSFNGDISGWDVSKVTNMRYMFYGASSFNGDISTWDVSRVTNMENMFNSASSFNGSLTSWDVSRVTDMKNMFQRATSFNGDISGWDVSRVTNMGHMFFGASSFNGNISTWDVSRVTNMGFMFHSAASFNGNISTWDVSRVTNTLFMFFRAASFNGDISGWDVSGVTNMFYMFNQASSFNQNLGLWYVVLSDSAVKSDTLAVGNIAAQNSYLDTQNPTYSLVSGTGDTDNSLFSITGNKLTIKQNPAKTSYSVRIGANASNIFGENNTVVQIITADIVKPTASWVTYKSGTGELTITFSEPLNATMHNASKIHIRNTGQNTGGVTLYNSMITTNGTNFITFDLNATDTNTVNAMSTPQLDIDSGAVRDMLGNLIDAAADQSIAVDDATKPTISSAVYKTGSGEFNATFNEPLDTSKHDASKIHIRNTGQNTGGVTLSNAIITTNGTNFITFDLDTTDTNTVNAMSAPQTDIDSGAVRDISGNLVAATENQSVTVRDTIKPTFSSATFATGSGVLNVTFSENLNQTTHNASKFHVRNTGESTGGVTLSNAMITANGTDSITFTLDSTNAATVNAMPAPQIDMEAGAVRDAAGNEIAAAADQTITINDTILPTFSSATFTTGSGILHITFSEALNQATHDASKFHVRNTGESTGGVILSNAMITANGTDSITFTLDSTNAATVNAMPAPQIDMEAGAVRDAAGNEIAAAADQTITINDTTPPEFTSATFTTGDGVLAINFSEPLKAAAHNASKIHIMGLGLLRGDAALSNSMITDNGTDSITFGLGAQYADTINALSGPKLDIERGAVSDTSGNQIAAASDLPITVKDTTPPEFVSATYTAGPGVLNVTFSEPLDPSKHVAPKLHIQNAGSSSGGVTLSNGTITANGTNFITFTLGAANRTAVNSMSEPRMSIDAGAVRDAAGNAIAAASDLPVSVIRPPPPPAPASPPPAFGGFAALPPVREAPLISMTYDKAPEPLAASYDSATYVMSVIFDEPVSVVDPDGFTLTLAGDSLTLQNFSSGMSRTLAASAPANATMPHNATLIIRADAVADSGGAGNPAHNVTVSVYDSAAPRMQSAVYHVPLGTLAVSFDQPLNNTNPALFHLGNSSLGNMSRTVASSGVSVYFTLNASGQDAITEYPYLSLVEGAATGLNGTASVPVENATVHLRHPLDNGSVRSAVYDAISGTLWIDISGESLTLNASAITLGNASLSDMRVRLNGELVSDGNGTAPLAGNLSLSIPYGAVETPYSTLPHVPHYTVGVFDGITDVIVSEAPGNATATRAVRHTGAAYAVSAVPGGIYVWDAFNPNGTGHRVAVNDAVLDMAPVEISGSTYVAVLTNTTLSLLDVAAPAELLWTIRHDSAIPYGTVSQVTMEGIEHMVLITPDQIKLMLVHEPASPRLISAAALRDTPGAGLDSVSVGSGHIITTLGPDRLCLLDVNDASKFAADCRDHSGDPGAMSYGIIHEVPRVAVGGTGMSVHNATLELHMSVEADSPITDVSLVSVYGAPYVAVIDSGAMLVYDVSGDDPALAAKIEGSFVSLDTVEFGGSAYVLLTGSEGAVYLVDLTHGELS